MKHLLILLLVLAVSIGAQAQKKKITVQGKVSLSDQKNFGRDGQVLVLKGPIWADTVLFSKVNTDGSFKLTVPDSTITYLFYFLYPDYRIELIQVFPELGDYHFDIQMMPRSANQQYYNGENIQWKSKQDFAQSAAHRATQNVSNFELRMVNTLMSISGSEESRKAFAGIDIQSELDQIETRIHQTNDSLLKQIYLIEYLCLDAAQQKVRRKKAPNSTSASKPIFIGDGKKEILDMVFQWVKPGTALWNIESNGNGVIWLFNKTDLTDVKLAYAEQIIKEQQGKHLAASVLLGLALNYNKVNEPGEFAKVYYQLISEYPGYGQTNKAKQEFKLLANMQVGNQVPVFSISSYDPNIATISSESMKGKVYLIDFWAPWCKGCIMAIPGLEKAYKKYQKKGLEIVSVLMNGNADWLRQFREARYKMPWIHGYDPQDFKSDIALKFEISSIPRSMLIGADGKILAVDPDKEQLNKILDEIL